MMKAKHTFARTSFLIISTLLVSFAFIKEFGFNPSETQVNNYESENILQEITQAGNTSSTIIVKFFNKADDLVYEAAIDLTKREEDKRLQSLLKESDLILKVDNELYFRTN